MLKLGVMGAAGRMGRAIIAAARDRGGCTIVRALESVGSPDLGQDAGLLAGIGLIDVVITADMDEAVAAADAVIDFTRPDASVAIAERAARYGKIHVIGTTGFEAHHEAAIASAARSATIVKAGNMSLGVNLLCALTQRVARALGDDFDIEILEMHHRHKVDAPSGTALMLGQAAAAGRGVSLADRSVRTRDGVTGPRRSGDIGFATLRGGSVVGEHEVIFAGDGEQVVLGHVATDRTIFARGALTAAAWAAGKPAGLYSMLDVLGLGDDNA